MKPTELNEDAYFMCCRAVAAVDALKLMLHAADKPAAQHHAKAAAEALAQCRRVLLDTFNPTKDLK
jgi:hypothetical protein